MTSIAKMRDVAQLPEDAPLRQSKFWNQSVESVNPQQVMAFVKRMETKGLGDRAKDDVVVLLDMIRKCVASGDITSAKLETFQLKSKTICIARIRQELSALTIDRRDAVLFAIASEMTLDEVALLRWQDVDFNILDTRARELVQYRPRHINTNLVFWEYVGKRLTSMLNLNDQFEKATNKTMRDYAEALEPHHHAMSDNDYWLLRRAFWKALL